jgi:predicted small secreted protein
MRKIFFVLALSVSLAGCATFDAITQGLSLATKTISNPVTKTEEAQVELALDTAVQALLAYKRACGQGSADVHCKANVAQIQAYTRQIPPLVAQLRTFVDNNDQINASVVYNQLTALYTNIKASALSLGVNIGA